jgi:translation elongation factor P/translation initiation factor 5A
MAKINGNEIRPGNVLEHNGGLWIAVKVDHVKPGKGGAFAQVEMKNLRNGSKLNERFRSADKVSWTPKPTNRLNCRRIFWASGARSCRTE